MEDKTPTGLREQQSRRKRVNKIRTSIVTGMFIWMLVVTVMLPVLLLRLFWLEDKVKELTESIVSVEQEVDNESRKSGAVSGEGMEDSVKDANQIEHEIGEASAQQDGAQKEDTPKAYLTFDDGPSDNTPRILDILKEKGVKATFFVIGQEGKEAEAIYRRIVEEGHTIGIHCDTHDYEQVYESVDSYVEDFEAARQTVYEVTGVDVKLFRFPGGSVNSYNQGVNEEIIEEMTERGYIYYDWNASLEDAVEDADPQDLIANGVETTLGRKKIIMLAHDVVYSTGICLNELLDQLPEYEMMPLDEDVEPIRF